MHIAVKTIWIAGTVLLSVAVLWFLFGTTAFFNRGVDLVSTVMFIIVWLPAVLLIIASLVLLIKGWMPNPSSEVAAIIVIIAISISLSSFLFYLGSPYGWLIPRVTRDWMQTTSDGIFEYRIELINQFQRNSQTRLYVKNTLSGKEKTIYLNISTDEFSGMGIEDSSSPPPNLMSSMMPTEMEYIYILTTQRVLVGVTGKFEIDMEARVATEIFRKTHYQTATNRVDYEDGQFRYSYSLQLTDTFEEGERTSIEVLLRLTVGNPWRMYFIPLVIDQPLLANEHLRQPRMDDPIIPRPPLWITIEESDILGQFLVQTTEELSEEITLTFLVDIETETAYKIE